VQIQLTANLWCLGLAESFVIESNLFESFNVVDVYDRDFHPLLFLLLSFPPSFPSCLVKEITLIFLSVFVNHFRTLLGSEILASPWIKRLFSLQICAQKM